MVEGKLKIKIAGSKVRITSSRPLNLSRIFKGKDPIEILTMVPLLYNICGKAHSIAAVRAFESAMGFTEGGACLKLRNYLLNLENLREHLWRIFLDWPKLLGAKAKIGEFSKINQELTKLMQNLPEDLLRPFCQIKARPPDIWHELQIYLKIKVFGAVDFADISTVSDLEQWSADSMTEPADFIRYIFSKRLASLGQQSTEYMSDISPKKMAARLAKPDVSGFVKEPLWQGKCLDTGPLARWHKSPLLQDIQDQYANGILARNSARLLEVWKILNAEVDNLPSKTEAGLAQVETSRGRLYHKVSLARDLVSNYAILAPTEWNFHPRGVAAKALKGINNQEYARLVIMSIDPCVDYGLEIAHA